MKIEKENQTNNFDIFLIFAQNIDCGYMLEPPRQAVLTSTHNVCFEEKIRKIYTPAYPSFFYIKWDSRAYSCHEHVFLMHGLGKRFCLTFFSFILF